MKKNIFFILLLMTSWGCSEPEATTQDETIGNPHDLSKIDLRKALPDGRYQGRGENIEPSGLKSSSDLFVSISQNRIFTNSHSGDVAGTAVDNLSYEGSGEIFWTDINNQKLGICACEKLKCTCAGGIEPDISGFKVIEFFKEKLVIKSNFQTPDGAWVSTENLFLQ